MSNYNTQLQSHNTDLQEVLQALQNKAAGGGGVELPELSNPAAASDTLSGKEFINQDGKKVTGTIVTKKSSDVFFFNNYVTVPSGYYSGTTAVSMGKTIQAIPTITVDSNGLITASATQTAGYVDAGTESSTYQLAFQAAKTITPSTVSQIAVSSGYYTGGDIAVAGDANLVAENIKSGVSIFGVNGTLSTGGGSGEAAEWSENEDAMIMGVISNYTNNRIINIRSGAFEYCSKLTTASFPACTTIGSYAFYSCTSLTTISFPVCTTIDNNAFCYCSKLTTASFPACTSISKTTFYNCYNLTTASFPVCTTIGSDAFYRCSNLTTISFPACTTIGSNVFSDCSKLTTASFPACTTIGNYAFRNCYNLSSIALEASTVCTLSNSNAFTSTPFAGYSTYFSGTPYIYVPSSLIDAYKSATNWTYFASYFSSIESLGGNLITFTIEDVEYQAEEGMTWGEWVESDYNTNTFIIVDNTIQQGLTLIDNVSTSVMIVKNKVYYIIIQNGGAN